MTDYYQVLQVPRNASIDDIKKSYRKLAVKMHPDTSKGNTAEQFKTLSEAYSILSDPQKKAAYDRGPAFQSVPRQNAYAYSQRQSKQPNPEEFFSSMFGSMYNNFNFREQTRQQQGGSSIQINLPVSLHDVFTGATKDIEFARDEQCVVCKSTGSSRQENPITCKQCNGSGRVNLIHSSSNKIQVAPCHSCSGTGLIIEYPCRACSSRGVTRVRCKRKITIPKGIATGMRMHIPGNGNAGPRGGKSGELFIDIEVQDNELFVRDGDNLIHTIDISYTTAVLGGKAEVKHLDGTILGVAIPKGTQHDHNLLLRHKGMPIFNGNNAYGNLLLNVKIQIPTEISEQQQKLLQELDKTFKQ